MGNMGNTKLGFGKFPIHNEYTIQYTRVHEYRRVYKAIGDTKHKVRVRVKGGQRTAARSMGLKTFHMCFLRCDLG